MGTGPYNWSGSIIHARYVPWLINAKLFVRRFPFFWLYNCYLELTHWLAILLLEYSFTQYKKKNNNFVMEFLAGAKHFFHSTLIPRMPGGPRLPTGPEFPWNWEVNRMTDRNIIELNTPKSEFAWNYLWYCICCESWLLFLLLSQVCLRVVILRWGTRHLC